MEHYKECPQHEDFECPNNCKDGVLFDSETGQVQIGYCDVSHGECICQDIWYDLEADAADDAREMRLHG
jgi:hypothetical protein